MCVIIIKFSKVIIVLAFIIVKNNIISYVNYNGHQVITYYWSLKHKKQNIYLQMDINVLKNYLHKKLKNV